MEIKSVTERKVLKKEEGFRGRQSGEGRGSIKYMTGLKKKKR